ncbi:MAG: carboxylating nicotinate-nucleotide diphosphorylase [Candidatus Celaenobacter polaris]|nr:carboxylating nicotinate-nucleotide diphosphorylase [Candidatus Celaenobacter polaris]
MNKIEKDIISLALLEDLGDEGDITSHSIFTTQKARYKLISRENGILCGSEYFTAVFKQLDPDCNIEFLVNDRNKINREQEIALVYGNIKNILTAERVAINFLSHLSAIATKTNQFCQLTKGNTKVLDTRKTIPGLRKAEKYAVRCGGGYNHRMGLFDMVLIKDNHIDGIGSIGTAVKKVREKLGNKYKIEVETRNLEEVKEALTCEVDLIMLDNMSIKMMKEAICIINGKAKTEASGNINLEKFKQLAEIGFDYISIGELTHTVKAFDFSLLKLNE